MSPYSSNASGGGKQENQESQNIRILPLQGLYNVRDLGGYKTETGQVKWRCLYRAGDMTNLRPQARRYLENRNIKTVVDFRESEERLYAPDGDIKTVIKTYTLPIFAGNIRDLSYVEDQMRELYQYIILESIPQLRAFFKILQEAGSAPLIFHCTAGKDRTGIVAALILSALGVDRETIYQDYMLSQTCLGDKYQAFVNEDPRLEPIMSVRLSYIHTAFRTIEETYGTPERYLQEELRADPEKLRALYTAPSESAT